MQAIAVIGTKRRKTRKTNQKRIKQKIKTRRWLVGFGDNLRGRRESVLKNDSPNLSTRRVFTVFLFSLLSIGL
jgi:hypothetical protein